MFAEGKGFNVGVKGIGVYRMSDLDERASRWFIKLDDELKKLRAVAEALKNYAFSRCTVGPGAEERRQILLSIAIERLEEAGYLE